MKVHAWLIDFAPFRENCPTGIIPESKQKVTPHNGIAQYKGEEVRWNSVWCETVASRTYSRIDHSVFYDTRCSPLFHAQTLFHLTSSPLYSISRWPLSRAVLLLKAFPKTKQVDTLSQLKNTHTKTANNTHTRIDAFHTLLYRHFSHTIV